MKNLYMTLAVLFLCLIFNCADAQDIYIKATQLNTPGNILSQNASPNAPTDVQDADGNKTLNLKDYMEVSSLSYDTEQTLSIGSQSTGAGAGKIVFNPLVITKRVDAASTKLFLAQAQGTAMDFEILFIANGSKGERRVVHKLLLKLVAVKNYGSAATGDCGSCPLSETISFEYGSLIMYTYNVADDGRITANAPVGWNRVNNTSIK